VELTETNASKERTRSKFERTTSGLERKQTLLAQLIIFASNSSFHGTSSSRKGGRISNQ
jgi:hypothetical protein